MEYTTKNSRLKEITKNKSKIDIQGTNTKTMNRAEKKRSSMEHLSYDIAILNILDCKRQWSSIAQRFWKQDDGIEAWSTVERKQRTESENAYYEKRFEFTPWLTRVLTRWNTSLRIVSSVRCRRQHDRRDCMIVSRVQTFNGFTSQYSRYHTVRPLDTANSLRYSMHSREYYPLVWIQQLGTQRTPHIYKIKNRKCHHLDSSALPLM